MAITSKPKAVGMQQDSGRPGEEAQLRELGINLPTPPEPFGTYAEAVQTGNLLFLSGMLPTEGRRKIHRAPWGRARCGSGAAGGEACGPQRSCGRPPLSRIARSGSARVVRLGVSVATVGDVRDQPKAADGASDLLQSVFGKGKNPCRLVYGVASLPLGTPVEVEIIFEVTP